MKFCTVDGEVNHTMMQVQICSLVRIHILPKTTKIKELELTI
jgi:hypothetical protein